MPRSLSRTRTTSRNPRRLTPVALLLTALLALAGCGGSSKTPAQRIADCLNGKSFLVEAADGRVEGTSPDGVAFTLAAASGRIDDHGNPGERRLSPGERTSIQACLH